MPMEKWKQFLKKRPYSSCEAVDKQNDECETPLRFEKMLTCEPPAITTWLQLDIVLLYLKLRHWNWLTETKPGLLQPQLDMMLGRSQLILSKLKRKNKMTESLPIYHGFLSSDFFLAKSYHRISYGENRECIVTIV